MAWLFLRGKFVENRKIALEWEGYAVPFLYSVPDKYQRDYQKLLKLTGIKKMFTSSDFLEALDSLWESKQDSCLTLEDIKLVVTLINELKNNFDDSVKQRVGTIPLPDTQCVLSNSEDLTIPESFLVKYAGNERYIHADINRNVALKLGAKQLRARRREKYGNTMSMSFGQFEKLTDRIKNILDSYPCDVGILKELVQNADDAKATEVQFIYDKRTLPMNASFRRTRMKSRDRHYVFTTTSISAKRISMEFANLGLEASVMTQQKPVSMELDSTLSII